MLYTGESTTVNSLKAFGGSSSITKYIVSACSVLIFDVFAQFARKSARSVAFCSLKNKSSFVMPNCDLACSGDTDAAAAMHTASIKAVHEF